MKKTFLILAMLFVSCSTGIGQDAGWLEFKGEHFIVYSDSRVSSSGSGSGAQTEKFSKETLSEAEKYYQRLANELGYARNSEFWTWDKRVKIYIFADKAGYMASGQHPEWSEGMADYHKKSIFSFAGSSGFIDSILPHEIAHLVFRDFIGLRADLPLWLDEGVAQWAEEKKQTGINNMVKLMYLKDSLLTLSDMMTIDIRKIVSKTNVYIRSTITRQGDRGVLFLTGDALVNTYYLQAASLVSFMISRFGSMEFANFCRQIRDGKSVEAAIKDVYYTHIRDLDEFEVSWRKYIEQPG